MCVRCSSHEFMILKVSRRSLELTRCYKLAMANKWPASSGFAIDLLDPACSRVASIEQHRAELSMQLCKLACRFVVAHPNPSRTVSDPIRPELRAAGAQIYLNQSVQLLFGRNLNGRAKLNCFVADLNGFMVLQKCSITATNYRKQFCQNNGRTVC